MRTQGNRSISRILAYFVISTSVILTGTIFCPSVQADQLVDEEGMKCLHDAIQQKQLRGAFKQLCKMADHDCGYSQCLLGIMYEKGLGAKKNIDRAIEWYRKAAEKGLADAQFRLGQLYYIGEDVKRDPKEAAKWLNKAAEQGVAEAQYYIGRMHLKGDGVPRDLKKAKRWLHLAADRGIADAKVLLSQSQSAKETIHTAKKIGRAIKKRHEEGMRLYGQTLENTEMSWKGYADIVNSLNQAAAASSSK